MVNCAVINCKNCTNARRKNKINVSFHRFPEEPNLKQKWIEATGNKDWFPTKHSTICSIHFEEASFVDGKKQRILTKAAYPTVDVLKITTDEIIDPKVTPEEALLSPKKRKLEKDVNELHKSNKSNPKNKKILKQLNQAEETVIQQRKQIKILRERNRRKAKKIHDLVALIESLKKRLINGEQANVLKTINVTSQELYFRQLKNQNVDVYITKY